jgi:cardiolipin synthase
MHLRIEGDAVRYLQDIFLTTWDAVTGQEIDGDQYYPATDTALTALKPVAIVDRIPRKMPKQLRETYLQSINSAQNIIQIVNPYFLPNRSIKRALKNALKRGVNVEIMISAKCDIPFTPDGSFYAAHRMMKKGARIYVYNDGFHHTKVMTVDSIFCTVGSANLDYRSLNQDYEVNAFIFDTAITRQLNSIFEADKEHSILLTPEEWENRSCWKRFVGWVANAVSPLL